MNDTETTETAGQDNKNKINSLREKFFKNIYQA